MNYAPSTRARIGDLRGGMHVKTTDAILTAAHFTIAAQTELFTVVGRIAVEKLFIELTATADANLTQMQFNTTFTTPAIGVNAMGAKCASIAALTAGTRIMHVGGAVATAAVLTDSAGLTDIACAEHILGGETAAGANYAGSIGVLGSDATQAATITATAHLFYYPLSNGAYAEALL